MDYRYQYFSKLKNFFELPRYYIICIVDIPSKLYGNVKEVFVSNRHLVQENKGLKQLANIQAVKLQKLNDLELENERLKSLLNFAESQNDFFSLAKIIDVNPDPFKQQIILNRGAEQGIYVDQPVLNADGLLGSVVSVAQKSSVAMLITDINYAVPVVNVRNGFRAIALGTGDLRQLTLQHVPNTADIIEKDIFVTSGLGGKYPAGYVVGYVGKVKKEINFPFASVSLTVSAKLDSCKEGLLMGTKNNR